MDSGHLFPLQESELRPSSDNAGVSCSGGGRSDSGDNNSSGGSSPISLSEDRMEPIAEENSPKSFERSFSFVSFDIIRLYSYCKLITFPYHYCYYCLFFSRTRKIQNSEAC